MDVHPCGPASRRTAPPAAANRQTAARLGRRSIAARSWSCRCPAPGPAPGCHRHARCRWPGRRQRGRRPAASAPPPWRRPNRTGSRSPGSPRRGRRSRPDDRAADDRRTSRRQYEPIAPLRPGRGQSRDRAPAPPPPCRKPGTTVSRECAGRPPLSRGQALEPARHVIEGLADLVGDLAQRAAATGTGARCGMPPILSGQMLRQRAPRRLLRFGRGLDGCRRLPAMPSPAVPPGRSPAPRAPARAARSHAPASPRNGRTRPADNAPVGTSAARSRPGRSAHPAPSRR